MIITDEEFSGLIDKTFAFHVEKLEVLEEIEKRRHVKGRKPGWMKELVAKEDEDEIWAYLDEKWVEVDKERKKKR